jgi:hypothetical protein
MNTLATLRRLVVPRICAGVALAAPALAGGTIAWDADWDAAFERAAREHRPVFLAVNMDGEAANDRLAEKVYADPAVVALSQRTVNLVASRFDHAGAKTCPRFPGIECVAHKRVDGAARQGVLVADPNGYVVAPQHVFLAPDRRVLLSVPYEVTAEELEWCFVAALQAFDPESAKGLSAPGRAPRRLIQGGVFDPSKVPGANLVPPTREQVLELLKEVKASLWGEGREMKILRILMSPEPEAVEYISAELKIDWFGRRGFGGGGGGGPAGPGGGAGAGAAAMGDRQDRLMHAIGVLSPKVYWKVVAEYLDHDDEKLRNEAVVALEQLAAPESLKTLLAAAGKEKSPKVRKDLLRAIGSAGAEDEKASKALIKALKSDKDELVRRNSVVALGWVSPSAEVNKTLADALAEGPVEMRAAAAIAMAVSRHDVWLPFLEKATGAGGAPELEPHVQAAITVLRGGSMGLLRPGLRTICGDDIERERFFGPAE